MNCIVLYNTFHATDGFNFLCYIYQFHENTCLLDDFDMEESFTSVRRFKYFSLLLTT